MEKTLSDSNDFFEKNGIQFNLLKRKKTVYGIPLDNGELLFKLSEDLSNDDILVDPKGKKMKVLDLKKEQIGLIAFIESL